MSCLRPAQWGRYVCVQPCPTIIGEWLETSHEVVSLIRLRELAEKRVWPRRRGLVITHCNHSVLCRRSREAPAANQRHYRGSTLIIFLFNFSVCKLCQYNQSLKLIRIASYKLINVHAYFMSLLNARMRV